jgi:hypothetical protein
MAGRATLTMVTSMLRMSTLMQQMARIRFGWVLFRWLVGFEGAAAALFVVRVGGVDRFSDFSKASPLIKMRADE